MSTLDQRRVIGAAITAKAIHVSNLAECTQRYGSNKRTKMLLGTVVEVTNTQHPSSNQTITTITGVYDLGGGTMKRTTLNIRSVKSYTAPENPSASALSSVSAPPVTAAPVATAAVATAAPVATAPDIVIAPVAPAAPVATAPVIVIAPVAAVPVTVTVVHGTEWYCDCGIAMNHLNNRDCAPKPWQMKDAVGEYHSAGSDKSGRLLRLDYFLLVFPRKQLVTMLQLTNESLLLNRKKAMTMGELLAFFGVMILATPHEFTSWASLWSTVSASKYTTAAAFGKTGMARTRFDSIWSNLEWSRQPCTRPDGMSAKKYHWLLVDGIVTEFNQYRASNFTPSDIICVDESISRWYGQGGHWINHGLPMYTAIDRKPENGCKIQNSACGRITIMMRLKLVKTAEEEATHMVVDEEDGLLHGTKVLLLLVKPWLGIGRTVCGDLYFASVGAAKEMEKKGMGFIGVVKTATRHFPMAYLTNIEIEACGKRAGVVFRDEYGIPRLMAFVWMDRDQRYFIVSSS
jgi:hypothetical protein